MQLYDGRLVGELVCHRPTQCFQAIFGFAWRVPVLLMSKLVVVILDQQSGCAVLHYCRNVAHQAIDEAVGNIEVYGLRKLEQMCHTPRVPISQIRVMDVLISTRLDVVSYAKQFGDLYHLIAVDAVANQQYSSVSEMRYFLHCSLLRA